jgi:hypothetical protein
MKRIILTILFCISIASPSWGAVIFSHNFDSQADWTVTQPAGGGTACMTPYSGCTAGPTNWTGYYNGDTYIPNAICLGTNQYNNMYIDAIPGYPEETSGTCYGGSGKCLSFWQERCCSQQVCGDGNIGVDLGSDYSELYIQWKMLLPTSFIWTSSGVPQLKISHIQSYSGSGSPWSYFHQVLTNQPLIVPGLKTYSGNLYYYVSYRCEGDGDTNYYCGNPSYSFDVSGDSDHVDLGTIGTYFDGNWHTFEFYQKTNSGLGVKDGVHKFWLDGSLKYDSSSNVGGHSEGIPFAGNAGQESPRHGWRFVSFGGNNSNATSSCTGAACEDWYAIDNVCISDSYIGDTVCGAGGDTTPPIMTAALPSGVQPCPSHPQTVSLSLTTDEVATCKYHTSDVIYDSMPNTFSTTGTTSHSQSVTLGCNQDYTFYARCSDSAGNKDTTSTTISFSVRQGKAIHVQ